MILTHKKEYTLEAAETNRQLFGIGGKLTRFV